MTTTTSGMSSSGGAVGSDPGTLAGMSEWLGVDYVVERALGHSGLSWTLLARGRLTGRSVVIKILADDLAGDEARRSGFLRAAELGMRLSHPNVVRVFESGVKRAPYVVMEHVAGETLAERLRRSGPFPAAETTRLAIQLAAGLAHAHASGVVHGALAPQRIHLGADDVARIGDFGFARVLAARPALCQAQDVHDFAVVLRRAGGDRLPPGLADLVDVAGAQPSVRPSVFDLLHELHAMTGPPGVWLPSANIRPVTAG